MLVLILTALVIIAITLVIHGVGTTLWLRHVLHRYGDYRGGLAHGTRLAIIIKTAILLICLHFLEILLWAAAYLGLAPDEIGSLEAAVYFSAVTFTTLGYGDITLTSSWRLLSGFEAIDGIVLIGWMTAFLFAVIQKTWSLVDGSGSGN